MYNYIINFRDEAGNIVAPVNLHWLKPDGEPVLKAGTTTPFIEIKTGGVASPASASGEAMNFIAKAAGFEDNQFSANPGTTNVIMKKQTQSAAANVTVKSNKWWIAIIIVIIILVFVYWFKIRKHESGS